MDPIHSSCGTVDRDSGGTHILLPILWNVQFHSLKMILKYNALKININHEIMYYSSMHKCMIYWFFTACFEKLSYFEVRHYCKHFCSLIGRQTVRINWQDYFLCFASTATFPR